MARSAEGTRLSTNPSLLSMSCRSPDDSGPDQAQATPGPLDRLGGQVLRRLLGGHVGAALLISIRHALVLHCCDSGTVLGLHRYYTNTELVLLQECADSALVLHWYLPGIAMILGWSRTCTILGLQRNTTAPRPY